MNVNIAYCPTCDENFGIGVSDENDIVFTCQCGYRPFSELTDSLDIQVEIPINEETPTKGWD